jgi:hypothetical protein
MDVSCLDKIANLYERYNKLVKFGSCVLFSIKRV